MMMKLYSVDLSPYSARVRMQIYAKGLSDIVIEGPAADWVRQSFANGCRSAGSRCSTSTAI